MLEPGNILQQRYRIDKQIGQGGMGAVYLATDVRFGSTVAIKETLFLDENYQRAIEREARLLNSLKHPALPRVSDHFIEDNGQFLVMEYIPGDDLAVMLGRMGRPFAVALVLQWADQLLDALDYLHGQQIPVIHRDIKPHNLKITPQGHAILLDFGLAKGNPTDASNHTAASSIFGYSRNYASLEQIQGTGTDPRSDLYSFAATLYHLSTGQPPVDALTRAMRVLGRQLDPLVPSHHVRGDLPIGFSGILHCSLDLDAAARPQSAVQLRQMLRAHDQYEHLAAAEQAAVSVVTNGSIEYETSLRPSSTQPQSGVSTEVLPANLSHVTSVRAGMISHPGAGDTATRVAVRQNGSRYRRMVAVAAACAATLFIVASVAAGALYFGRPTALFGSGKSANGRQEQADSADKPVDPAESGDGVKARTPNLPSQDPSGPPGQPVQPGHPAQPLQSERPEGPAIAPGPSDRGPRNPETVRSDSPASEPKHKRTGIRVDSVEIDRLPGGIRGVKVTRGREKKPDSEREDNDGGFKITKIPNIFRDIPSRLRDPVRKDGRKQQVVTRPN
jgi:serine/threonine protein kinase